MAQDASSTALRSTDPSTLSERRRLLKPYLPDPEPPSKHKRQPKAKGRQFHHKQRIRPALRHALYSFIFAFIHFFFGIYLRIRQVYHTVVDRVMAILYYHHRTPELISRDVKKLSKVPRHLSVILQLPPEGQKKDRMEGLVNDACEVAAWSACAGIPVLSIYEKTGALKHSLPQLHRRINSTLAAYYGLTSPSKPTLSLRAPHLPSYSPPTSPDPSDETPPRPRLTILLIDASDGRQTLVDLTKTLAEMSQHGKLAPKDISSELIDAEITESVMGEPDLLVLFGNKIMLDGYPPWQARLTEIFGVQDNEAGVGYHVFLRALYKFAKAEFRVGK